MSLMTVVSPSETAERRPDPAEPAERRSIYWYYVVVILTLISTFNYLDRQIINILAEPIKRDLQLKDWQLGVLTGFAFAIVYSLAAVPLARLAERRSRPLILAACLAVWSLFTALSGFTRNFGEFALARLGVGLGEAGSSPPAHALIVDLVPVERRAFALGVFQAGVPLGGLAGLALGGILADRYGWRFALIAAGLPGLLLALTTLLTVVEPRSRTKVVPTKSTFIQDARSILSRKAFLLIIIGGGLVLLKALGTQAFLGSFFFRNHAEELSALAVRLSAWSGSRFGEVAVMGTLLGVLGGIAGIVGTIWGGALADRWARRDSMHYVSLIAIPQVAAAPVLIAGLFWPGLTGAMALITIATFINAVSVAPTWAAVQALATDATRATAVALGFLIVTLIGLGAGPLLVGITSDVLNGSGMPSSEALRWGMVVAVMPSLIGAALVWRARRYAREEMAHDG
jgi:MFS family permease